MARQHSKYNINVLKIVPDNETWLYTKLNTVMLEHQCSITVMYAVLHSKVSGSSPGISKGGFGDSDHEIKLNFVSV